jgi:hypothetical protein
MNITSLAVMDEDLKRFAHDLHTNPSAADKPHRKRIKIPFEFERLNDSGGWA